jgi:hypothetical protein
LAAERLSRSQEGFYTMGFYFLSSNKKKQVNRSTLTIKVLYESYSEQAATLILYV